MSSQHLMPVINSLDAWFFCYWHHGKWEYLLSLFWEFCLVSRVCSCFLVHLNSYASVSQCKALSYFCIYIKFLSRFMTFIPIQTFMVVHRYRNKPVVNLILSIHTHMTKKDVLYLAIILLLSMSSHNFVILRKETGVFKRKKKCLEVASLSVQTQHNITL